MKLSAITVCVDYSEHLSQSLCRWRDGVDNLLVVSSPGDGDTITMCQENGVQCLQTNCFWMNGAKFNKGLAISQGFLTMLPKLRQDDWVLFFDADIIPEESWREKIRLETLDPSCLYGAWRHDERGKKINDPGVCGWFFLANMQSPGMQKQPIMPVEFYHAGCYDSVFADRWPQDKRKVLPLHLTHLGETWENWCGVGNSAAMEELLKGRRQGRPWQRETI